MGLNQTIILWEQIYITKEKEKVELHQSIATGTRAGVNANRSEFQRYLNSVEQTIKSNGKPRMTKETARILDKWEKEDKEQSKKIDIADDPRWESIE